MDLEILKIAADTKNHKIVKNFTHISKLKNNMCGDEMEVSLKIKNNKISDFGYQCKSCIFCQASASMLSNFSVNKSINKVNEIIQIVVSYFQDTKSKFPKEWKKLEKLFNEKNISRKDCLLLPFKTLAKALKS